MSYLVYGCETCDELSGTVDELLETHDMGILIENFGIKRSDVANPSSALFDTSGFISRYAGDYRFLYDRKDEKCSFYGAESDYLCCAADLHCNKSSHETQAEKLIT